MNKVFLKMLCVAGIAAVLFSTGCEDEDSDVTIAQLVGTYDLIDITFIKADGQVRNSTYLQLQGGVLVVNPDGSYTETHLIVGITQYGSGTMKEMGGKSLELTAIPSGRIIPAEVTFGDGTMTMIKWPPNNGEVHTMVWRRQ